MILGAMAGSDLDSMMDRIQRLQGQRAGPGCDLHDLVSAARGMAFDTKVIRQAIKLHRRKLAGRKSDRGLLASYNEAVEIDMHESWF